MAEKCACGGKAMIVLPCSGSADVGEIADRAGRKLSRETCFKMGCLAGVGAGLSGFVASTEEASRVVAIDGCPVACASKTLTSHGVKKFKQLLVTDLFAKGKSPCDDARVQAVFDKAKKLV